VHPVRVAENINIGTPYIGWDISANDNKAMVGYTMVNHGLEQYSFQVAHQTLTPRYGSFHKSNKTKMLHSGRIGYRLRFSIQVLEELPATKLLITRP
jgi:hypothetical protein